MWIFQQDNDAIYVKGFFFRLRAFLFWIRGLEPLSSTSRDVYKNGTQFETRFSPPSFVHNIPDDMPQRISYTSVKLSEQIRPYSNPSIIKRRIAQPNLT